ncbi:hypothetical protein PGT21_011684 [Puccinia graminis f. sp. tritici]|uniref:Uncharacterized protein n=1 Tax=Puccinia graminis f. sp. tritici TaxID=56615 RepID=A0A5B0NKJ4_PUCGR|nr:hypothetical protein PGT21_011684 [Puccinia graminis f. sp. tritici]
MFMMVSGSDSRHNNHLGFNRFSIINFTNTAMRSRASHQLSSAECAVHRKSGNIVLVN